MERISLQDLAALMQQQGARQPPKPFIQFKAGKCVKVGKTVTPSPRKGMCIVIKQEDVLHFQWKDRTSGNIVDDMCIFPDDAVLKHVPQCKTGKVILLEFPSTGRQEFYWIQEPNCTDEKVSEWIEKGNQCLSGNIPADLLAQQGPTGQADPNAPALQTPGGPVSANQLMQLLGMAGAGGPGGAAGLPGSLAGLEQLMRQQPSQLHTPSGRSVPRQGGPPMIATPAGPGGGPAGGGSGGSGGHAGSSANPIGEDFLRQVLGNLGGPSESAACKPRTAPPPPAKPVTPTPAPAPAPATPEKPAAKPAPPPPPKKDDEDGPAPMEKEEEKKQ